MNQLWSVTLAGIELPCSFRFPDTHRYFSAVPLPPDDGASAPITVREAEWRAYLRTMPENAHTEYSVFSASLCDALLDYDRMILHGAALRWRDRAWLICGPSGVGKSTQTRFLQELRPGEFGVICGDRPILQFCHSERSEESASPVPTCHSERSEAEPKNPYSILVHPSPWNGKENWHGAEAAPLAGIVLLRRGEENSIEPLRPARAAAAMFQFVIQTLWDEEKILSSARFVERLLASVPIWIMTSCQVPASTKLLSETVFTP